MAVYNLKVGAGSRAGGASAASKWDYFEREGKYSRDQEDLRESESEHMPEWAEDNPRSYWEAADQYERANGRLYREVHFALPGELNHSQQKELAQDFAKDLTGSERLPSTLVIHEGAKAGRPSNPHVHLMWSERGNDGIERSAEQWFKRYNAKQPERGGAKKSKAGDAKDWVPQIRERWAERCNAALERAGHRERVDHRSLSERAQEAFEQGDVKRGMELSREPNVHLGPAAMESVERMTQGKEPLRKVQLAREIQQRNQERGSTWEVLEKEFQGLKRDLAGLAKEFREITRQIPEAAKRAMEWTQSRSFGGPDRDGGFYPGR